VDSGSPSCLFHADIAKAHGIRVEEGDEGPLGGVIGGARGLDRVVNVREALHVRNTIAFEQKPENHFGYWQVHAV
jgi:hypothetical protein